MKRNDEISIIPNTNAVGFCQIKNDKKINRNGARNVQLVVHSGQNGNQKIPFDNFTVNRSLFLINYFVISVYLKSVSATSLNSMRFRVKHERIAIIFRQPYTN